MGARVGRLLYRSLGGTIVVVVVRRLLDLDRIRLGDRALFVGGGDPGGVSLGSVSTGFSLPDSGVAGSVPAVCSSIVVMPSPS